MLFNSWEFILFLSIIIPVYYLLSHRSQNYFLIAASYFFYGYWDYRFLSLIIISTLVNYFLGLKIQSSQNRHNKNLFLIFSLMCNLGFLGFFKYCNFFIESFSFLVARIGLTPSFHTLNIILPLGISFYTFQILSYVIDIYRNKQHPTSDFISFALYVCYFPQLVAGPIERAQRLLPKIQTKRHVSKENIYAGIQLILIGYVKKIAIADAVAPYVNTLFANHHSYLSLDLLCGVYLFALQIYGDFSGYSDIARGVSKLMGIDLMINFKQPYFSRNVSEFWKRWHISLSSWLRDYLYITLGGNRNGQLMTYRNLFVTMFLGGLWHGASWVFILWGCLHGIYLSLYRYLNERKSKADTLVQNKINLFIGDALSVIFTFHIVSLTWVFFRAPDLKTAYSYLSTLFNPSFWGYTGGSLSFVTLFYILFVFALDFPMYKSGQELLLTNKTHWTIRSAVYAGLILILTFLGESNVQPFIYFQF